MAVLSRYVSLISLNIYSMQQFANAFLNVVLFGALFLTTFVGGVLTGGAYIQIAEAAPGIGAQVAALAMATTSTNDDRAKPPKEMSGVMPGNNLGSSTPGVRAMGVPACINLVLKASLKRGSQGDDVSKLQKLLMGEGYLASSSPLGFFGPLTERAVAKWQYAQGIASSSEPNANSGAGMVGPRTRALFQKCENRIERRGDMLMGSSTKPHDPMRNDMKPGPHVGSTTLPTNHPTVPTSTVTQ